MARVIVIAALVAVAAAAVYSRWTTGETVAAHRERVLDLCTAAFADAAVVDSPQALRADLNDGWDWGVYEFDSRLFADRLVHDVPRFQAVRVARFERLPGEPPMCRQAMCVYSIPLDRATAGLAERKCGGAGETRLVTPTLKPDLLRQR